MSGASKSASCQTPLTERRVILQPSCNLGIPGVESHLQSKGTSLRFSANTRTPSQLPTTSSPTFRSTKPTGGKTEEDRIVIARPSFNIVVTPARAQSTSSNTRSKDCPSTPPSTVIGSLKMSAKTALLESNAQRNLRMTAYGRKKDRTPKPGRIAPEGMIPKEAVKKRCGWITSQSDTTYVAYHDEEWGAPIHHDRRLFELLALAGLQADITWSKILTRRNLYRAAFADFDPALVATFDDEMITWISGEASLNKGKVEAIVENAKHVLEVIREFGTLDEYLWSFVNYKPIVSTYRHGKQIPVKTPKSDAMSKDLMRKGFRGVGATVIYSLMQAAGLTNDHLVECFRHEECKRLHLMATYEKRDDLMRR